jgi:hypothetical protein
MSCVVWFKMKVPNSSSDPQVTQLAYHVLIIRQIPIKAVGSVYEDEQFGLWF